MLFSEKVKEFEAAHPCETITVDGAEYRYVMSGAEGGKTLVLLNGGMNTLEMWLDYVDDLAKDYRVLLFDYPQELRTNQELVVGMHAFFKALGVEQPIFVGASDGGMVAQIYVQKFPGETGGLILVSTGGMDAETLKSELAAKGIEFVSRYSFWAIFRSEHDFQLYSPKEELDVCRQMYRPMPIGSVLSWIAFIAFLLLSIRVSAWFVIPVVLFGIYAAMCTCLGISYARLIRKLRQA